MKQTNKNKFDIVVVGGGHAGIEAAIVAANMGMDTALVTMEINKIGLMSCNPAIGGLAKGQLVREIDALGGIMGKISDAAGIHFKMLNTSKGPAVQSPRAQADRAYYSKVAKNFTLNTRNLTVIEDAAIGVKTGKNKIIGVILKDGSLISTRAAILTNGTFLNGLIHVGDKKISAGRAGEMPATGITESLQALGFTAGRLKTGTPPRIHRDSIDYTKVEVQAPDKIPVPFSFSTDKINRQQINCYITYTNTKTHDILRTGFDRSPMFTGTIKGVGPRYCPSIEDKINRFSDKNRHQLFLENGTSGYEEAAAQGFMAGLNAALKLKGQEPFMLGRSEAYIGVLIDDLINKTHDEPYRMFTSRAEFRLLLRHDNADLRLMEYGRNFGLVDDQTYGKYLARRKEIDTIQKNEMSKKIGPKIFNSHFKNKSSNLTQAVKVKDLIKRPEISLRQLLELVTDKEYSNSSIGEVEFNIKYSGYIERQSAQIEKFRNIESKLIPADIDYTSMQAMSVEAREKLTRIKPVNIGQASRISGVSPADLSVLVIYLEKHKHGNVPRETGYIPA
ncbi:MAG: FAD-dependent oxidoreductase [Calditrichaceae bacterium]